MVPYSGRRQQQSSEFYGQCVSQWVTVTDGMEHHIEPDVLVINTNPIKVKTDSGIHEDENALSIMKHTYHKKKDAKLVLITHRSNEMFESMKTLEKSGFPHERMLFMFLSEHTEIDAKQRIIKEYKTNNSISSWIPTAFFNPVTPLHYITHGNDNSIAVVDIINTNFVFTILDNAGVTTYTELLTSVFPGVTLTVQGKYGGKHGWRKHPDQVVACVEKLEKQMRNQTLHIPDDSICMVKDDEYTYHKVPPSEKYLFKYGSLEKYVGDFMYNKLMNSYAGELFSWISTDKEVTQKNIFKSFRGSSKNATTGSTTKTCRVNVDLVGKFTDAKNSYGHLDNGIIRLAHNLPYNDFYGIISRANFMVGALNSPEYSKTIASSTIHVAMSSMIPLIAKASILRLYPCLREKPIHKKINVETECESLAMSLQLTAAEYSELKAEAQACSEQYWKDSKATFERVLG